MAKRLKMKRQAPGSYYSEDGRVHVFSYVRPDHGYDPFAGRTEWQIEIDGKWPYTDPFFTKREAVACAEELLGQLRHVFND